MRTAVPPPQDPAFCTPVPGTDLYLHAIFSSWHVELETVDSAGDPAGPHVRVDAPNGASWGAAEGYGWSEPGHERGQLSSSSGWASVHHPDGHRAFAFAADLAADLLDALREGAEGERVRARREKRAERAAMEERAEAHVRVDARVARILRWLSGASPYVRLTVDGKPVRGALVGVEERPQSSGPYYLVVLDGEGGPGEVPLRKVEQVEMKSSGRYTVAFTRAQVALNEDPDSYAASELGLDPDLPAPGAYVVWHDPHIPPGRVLPQGVVAWQVTVDGDPAASAQFAGCVAVLLDGRGSHPTVLSASSLEEWDGEPEHLIHVRVSPEAE